MLKPFSIETAHEPKLPDDLAARGMAYAERGNLVAALRSMHRAIASDDDCYPAWLGLVEIFSGIGDSRRAGQCLRIARQLRARGPVSSETGRLQGSAIA